MILLPSSVPLFASGEQRKGRFVTYLDQDGLPASCNFAARQDFRKCVLCGNCCIQFVLNEDDGTYTCSACGKFPREVILQ